jgi:hypothetical protein
MGLSNQIRGDLSMKVLQKVLEVFRAQLVIQTEEESRADEHQFSGGRACGRHLAVYSLR